jgi:hypothetical protein
VAPDLGLPGGLRLVPLLPAHRRPAPPRACLLPADQRAPTPGRRAPRRLYPRGRPRRTCGFRLRGGRGSRGRHLGGLLAGPGEAGVAHDGLSRQPQAGQRGRRSRVMNQEPQRRHRQRGPGVWRCGAREPRGAARRAEAGRQQAETAREDAERLRAAHEALRQTLDEARQVQEGLRRAAEGCPEERRAAPSRRRRGPPTARRTTQGRTTQGRRLAHDGRDPPDTGGQPGAGGAAGNATG